jgi:hypothetical protein
MIGNINEKNWDNRRPLSNDGGFLTIFSFLALRDRKKIYPLAVIVANRTPVITGGGSLIRNL